MVCRHIFHSKFLSNEWNDMRQKPCWAFALVSFYFISSTSASAVSDALEVVLSFQAFKWSISNQCIRSVQRHSIYISNYVFALHISIILLLYFSIFFLLFSLRCRRWKDGKRKTLEEGTHTSSVERTITASAAASATNNNGCRVAELERKVNLGLVIRFIAFYILIQILLEWSGLCGHIFRVSFSQTFGFCRRRRQFAWLLLVSCTFRQRKMCWFSLMNAALAFTLCRQRVCVRFRFRSEKKGLLFPVCWFVFFSFLSPLASSPHVPLRMVTLSKPLSAWWHLKYTDFVPKFTFPF